MVRAIPTIYGVLFAGVAVPVFGAVLLVILAVVPPIIDAVAVSGPGGVGKSSIAFGESWLLFVSIGLLSIVGSIALALLITGDTNEPPRRRP